MILDDIWLSFYPGAKIGVLGANGAGKSSLLRIMAGVDQDFQGEAWAREGDARSGTCRRSRSSTRRRTCAATSRRRWPTQRKLLDRFNEISAAFAEPDADFDKLLDEQARVQERIDTLDLWNLDNKIEIAMDALRLPPDDADVTKLSGGEKRRVALCRVLLEQPDMLLLDEPTNHLDAESVEWLERFLAEFPGTVVAITHDRYFLDNVAKWILELDRGKGIPYEGNYSSVARAEARAARAGGEDRVARASARCSASSSGCAWRRARGRRRARRASRSTRSCAREDTGEKVLAERDHDPAAAAARQRRRDREGPEEGVRRQGAVRRPDVLAAARRHRRRDRAERRGQDDAVPHDPRRGDSRRRRAQGRRDGELAYVDQGRVLDREQDGVSGSVARGATRSWSASARSTRGRICRSFNFRGTDQQKKVGDLSGGERNRLHLAKLLKSGGNVLLLDEPTNDLDVDTLRALEEALLDFAGCAVVISHDRWFLDRIATHILAFEGNSEVVWFEGNFKEYDADLRRRKGADADQPHRVTYKKLVRS